MIPVGVACSCLVVSYLCVYATGNWLVAGDCLCARATHNTDHLPITLITSIKMVISPVVSTSVSPNVSTSIRVV